MTAPRRCLFALLVQGLQVNVCLTPVVFGMLLGLRASPSTALDLEQAYEGSDIVCIADAVGRSRAFTSSRTQLTDRFASSAPDRQAGVSGLSAWTPAGV